jgi:hypothetical protein
LAVAALEGLAGAIVVGAAVKLLSEAAITRVFCSASEGKQEWNYSCFCLGSCPHLLWRQ